MKLLTDIDGVWLDWIVGFTTWIKENKGLEPKFPKYQQRSYKLWCDYYEGIEKELMLSWIEDYNASDESDEVPSISGAEATLEQISWFIDVVAITANHGRRIQLLEKRFPCVFSEIIVVPLGCNKREILVQYEPSIWLEDHYENCLTGLDCGHHVVMFTRPHNKNRGESDNVFQLENWKHGSICRVDDYDQLCDFLDKVAL